MVSRECRRLVTPLLKERKPDFDDYIKDLSKARMYKPGVLIFTKQRALIASQKFLLHDFYEELAVSNLIFLSLQDRPSVSRNHSFKLPASLKRLFIHHDDQFANNINPNDIPLLKELSLKHISDFSISNIVALKNLNSIVISASVVDLAGINELKNIHRLKIECIVCKSIPAISGLNNLETLLLRTASLETMPTLPLSIKNLSLIDSRIESITWISNLRYLQRLSLKNNAITNIDDLKPLTALTWLDLSNNPISDISALKNKKYLEFLDLTDTKVEDSRRWPN
jgi:Leucine-rich repeat (LRR) protein